VGDTERIARDTVGLTGLVGLGATTLGADRAALLPFAWTAVVIAPGPATGSTFLQALTWKMQPAESITAWVTAFVLGLSGTVMYAAFGPRS
jgi:hypothetical protein